MKRKNYLENQLKTKRVSFQNQDKKVPFDHICQVKVNKRPNKILSLQSKV